VSNSLLPDFLQSTRSIWTETNRFQALNIVTESTMIYSIILVSYSDQMASRIGTPRSVSIIATPTTIKTKPSTPRTKTPNLVVLKPPDIPVAEDAYNTELYSLLKREQSISKKMEVAIKRAQNNHKVRAQLAVSYIKKIGGDPTSPDALLHKVCDLQGLYVRFRCRTSSWDMKVYT
jgi:hypothetical protein